MRLTAGLVAAATLAAVSAVPAEAAKRRPRPPAKVCNLIVDDASDARPVTDKNYPSDDSLDVIGGDFATNGKKVTGIVRVKALQQPNPRSPLGQIYFVTFKVKGVEDLLTLSASLVPTGNQYKFGYDGEDANGVATSYTLGDATGSVTGNEIRITADIAKFPQAKFLKNGNSVLELGAEGRVLVGQRQVPSQNVGPARVPFGGGTLKYDTAIGKKYTLGAPSCVVIK